MATLSQFRHSVMNPYDEVQLTIMDTALVERARTFRRRYMHCPYFALTFLYASSDLILARGSLSQYRSNVDGQPKMSFKVCKCLFCNANSGLCDMYRRMCDRVSRSPFAYLQRIWTSSRVLVRDSVVACVLSFFTHVFAVLPIVNICGFECRSEFLFISLWLENLFMDCLSSSLNIAYMHKRHIPDLRESERAL
jgi:hypothetical protein